MGLKRALNTEDVRKAARRKLPKAIFDIIDGGHGDDVTLRANRRGFQEITFRPRAFADVQAPDLRTTVFGRETAMPLLLAPCSFARLCDPQAELAVARAAGRAGIEYAVPGGSSERPEVVATAATGSLWYQLYMKPDPAVNAELVQRVKDAGYRVLAVTIDTPIKPFRETDLRNGMQLPVQITPQLLLMGLAHPWWAKKFVLGNTNAGYSLTAARNAYANFSAAIGNLRPVTRADLAWLREAWDGPLVVKGILRHEEIDDMVALGVDGIVVSNHGGRNMDTTPATINALPRIVEEVAGRMEVFLDGGIRRGADVMKAVALGATAVLMGRPYLFGLAAGGEAGVDRVLNMVRLELEFAMAFGGAATIADIDASLVSAPAAGGAHGRGWAVSPEPALDAYAG
jgi:isopentenyl diphosphate isomerase/L-lactate dehydrogenase-like FMN-dependent dehydrogenase